MPPVAPAKMFESGRKPIEKPETALGNYLDINEANTLAGDADLIPLKTDKRHPIDFLEPSMSQLEASPDQTKPDAPKVIQGSHLLPNLPPDETGNIIGSYKITKTLGQGTFGKVKEGVHLFSKQKVSHVF
jgi:hypothetical protein